MMIILNNVTLEREAFLMEERKGYECPKIALLILKSQEN